MIGPDQIQSESSFKGSSSVLSFLPPLSIKVISLREKFAPVGNFFPFIVDHKFEELIV